MSGKTSERGAAPVAAPRRTDPEEVLEIEGGAALRGSLRVPGDKSISHRSLLLSALAEGSSTVVGRSRAEDVERTARVIESLGASIEVLGEGVEVVRGGRSRLVEPTEPLYCGNSGTTMRLLVGMLASLDGLFVLRGDSSLSSRPMDRVLQPLAKMGAKVDARQRGTLAPLVVRGGGLQGAVHEPSVASAQVKGAILLAGLGASGETVVRERQVTRSHTEDMLALAGASIDVEDSGASREVRVRRSELHSMKIEVPGDPSQAAFWIVAACCVPGSEVLVEDVYVGQGRSGFLDVLGRMGADVELHRNGPESADVLARYSRLRATDVGGQEVPSLVDEVPILAVAAACAEGTTVFSGAGELRTKESDRIETTVAALRSFGVAAEAAPDGLRVVGGGLRPGDVDAHGDHRIAMASAVAAMVAEGASRVSSWDSVRTSYPGFNGHLDLLRRS